jgi:nucleoside 2-deoxyribosyltransferase
MTVIIGSFRRHLNQALQLKQQLENHKVRVLSPCSSPVINPDDEFVIFSSDPVSHPKILQDSVFRKIKRSTFIVVANVDGYLGKATLIEIGYAIASGIDIYTLEPVDDPHLIPYCKLLSDIFPNISLTASAATEGWDLAYEYRFARIDEDSR